VSLVDSGVGIGQPSAVQNKYRTLAGFSTAAQSKMSGQEFFEVYRTYYGYGDYAHRFVMSALDGTQAFAGKSDIARVECAKKGSAYLNVWMYVIREMEDAIMDCKAHCIDCNDDPVHAWDEAVAFYAGSMEGQGGEASGKLLHELADKRCNNFGTCDANGAAAVNKEVMKQFASGQTKILKGKCVEVIPIKKRIVELMSVPLVQGALRYAYKVAEEQGGPKEKAEGAAFAAAILPRIAACDADAADLINQNMRIDAGTSMKDGFASVRKAFHRTYRCLGITCGDIGGILKTEGKYYHGAEPCAEPSTALSEPDDSFPAWAIALIVLAFVSVAMLTGVSIYCWRRSLKYEGLLNRVNEESIAKIEESKFDVIAVGKATETTEA